MAGCCIVLLAPIMLAIAAVLIAVVIGLLLAGILFISIGIITKFVLKDEKYQFVPNICLTIGVTCILVLLGIEFPLFSGIASIILGLILIKRNNEWKLLLYYVPVMVLIIVLGIPQLQLVESSIVLPILIFTLLVIGCIVGVVWLALQGRKDKDKPILMKEAYSLIFFSEATLSFLTYATMLYIETSAVY